MPKQPSNYSFCVPAVSVDFILKLYEQFSKTDISHKIMVDKHVYFGRGRTKLVFRFSSPSRPCRPKAFDITIACDATERLQRVIQFIGSTNLIYKETLFHIQDINLPQEVQEHIQQLKLKYILYAPPYTNDFSSMDSYPVLGAWFDPNDEEDVDLSKGDMVNLRTKRAYFYGDPNDEMDFLQNEIKNNEYMLLFKNSKNAYYAIRCGKWNAYTEKYKFTKCNFHEDQTREPLGEWYCMDYVPMKDMDKLIKYTQRDEIYIGCFK
mgnify:CR=1 FL=1